MKFVLVLLAIDICCFGMIEAGPDRRRTKRSIGERPCPADRDCEEYVKELAKVSCAFYTVDNDSFGIADCGSIICEGNLKKTKEDLSKPYPHCCSKCAEADE